MNVSKERLEELIAWHPKTGHPVTTGTCHDCDVHRALRELRALRERHKEAIKLLIELEANPSIEVFRRTARFLSNEIDPFTGA